MIDSNPNEVYELDTAIVIDALDIHEEVNQKRDSDFVDALTDVKDVKDGDVIMDQQEQQQQSDNRIANNLADSDVLEDNSKKDVIIIDDQDDTKESKIAIVNKKKRVRPSRAKAKTPVLSVGVDSVDNVKSTSSKRSKTSKAYASTSTSVEIFTQGGEINSSESVSEEPVVLGDGDDVICVSDDIVMVNND